MRVGLIVIGLLFVWLSSCQNTTTTSDKQTLSSEHSDTLEEQKSFCDTLEVFTHYRINMCEVYEIDTIGIDHKIGDLGITLIRIERDSFQALLVEAQFPSGTSLKDLDMNTLVKEVLSLNDFRLESYEENGSRRIFLANSEAANVKGELWYIDNFLYVELNETDLGLSGEEELSESKQECWLQISYNVD